MNGLQSVSQWQNYFGSPTGGTLGLFNAAYSIGSILGVWFIPTVSDKFGRKKGLALGAFVSVVGAIIQAVSMNFGTFVAARIILGAGCVITAGVGAPFITEIAHPTQRTTATAFFLTSWAFGAIVAGWTTFGTFRLNSSAAWRIPSGLQGFPALLQLIGVWWVPESPRWLMSKGKHEEAWQTIVKYHAEGDETDPLAIFEFAEIKEAIAVQESRALEVSPLQRLLSLFRTPGNRKRTAIMIWAACCSQQSGNAFVSYYLSPILKSVGLTSDLQQTLINATSSIFSWCTALYFATLPARVGRRTLFLASLVAMWVVVISITTGSAMFAKNPNNKAAGYTVVVMLYLFSPAYNCGFNGNLGLYIPEILPYNLRTTGLAFFYFVQTCWAILAQFATPLGLDSLKWKYYIIFVVWIMVEFVGVYFLFPETKGPSLEDIAFIFDGKDGQQRHLVDEETLVQKVDAVAVQREHAEIPEKA